MEKYENLGPVGEGSYGMVLKCRHKETTQLVAIKKFLDSDEDRMVKKIAMREVRMLRSLRHENLVNLIEVFRRKKRLYLVFEFVDNTILDELEKYPNGLDEGYIRKILWQTLRVTEFCHSHNIIHRDIKPENILISKSGVVKLCDFGFARLLAQPGENYTDYVATRWYRAPELLVGDTKYGKDVDIWALGCLIAELLTGDPLFPGDSDLDQLHQIIKCLGNLKPRYKEIFLKNPGFAGTRFPEVGRVEPFEKKFKRVSVMLMDILKKCLSLDADVRPTCAELLKHDFFCRDGFSSRFIQELKLKVAKENEKKPLLNNKSSARSDKSEKTTTESSSGRGSKSKKGKEPGASKITRKTSIDEGSADKKSSSVKKEAVPPKVTKKQQKTPPGSEGASHAMPPINGHAISTNTKAHNKSPPAKKVLHTNTVGVRGRSDSLNSNESLDLGIRSEKPTIHERSTPTKTKAPVLIINRSDNVRTSQEAGVVSLPELAISATEIGRKSGGGKSSHKSDVKITSLFESPRNETTSPGSLPFV